MKQLPLDLDFTAIREVIARKHKDDEITIKYDGNSLSSNLTKAVMGYAIQNGWEITTDLPWRVTLKPKIKEVKEPMNCQIKVTSEDVGDSNRGSHQTVTIIEFLYPTRTLYADYREVEIVEEITKKTWHTIRNNNAHWRMKVLGPHTYRVEHGYNSGD